MRILLPAVIFCALLLASGCDSQSPIAQNDITFSPFKGVPDTSLDHLYPIYPNPFNRVVGDTALFIRFSLHDTGSAILLVQNAIGDAITEFRDSSLAPGVYGTHWQPLAHDGVRLHSGLYFVTLHTKNYINSRLVNIQENE